MSHVPNDLKYSESHEWARNDGEGVITVGITEHAQALLGDIVFVELPEEESDVDANKEVGVIESVKAASDIYTPVSGKIIEINSALQDDPQLVNSDPYGEGWLFRIQMSKESELDDLFDADRYQDLIAAEEH